MAVRRSHVRKGFPHGQQVAVGTWPSAARPVARRVRGLEEGGEVTAAEDSEPGGDILGRTLLTGVLLPSPRRPRGRQEHARHEEEEFPEENLPLNLPGTVRTLYLARDVAVDLCEFAMHRPWHPAEGKGTLLHVVPRDLPELGQPQKGLPAGGIHVGVRRRGSNFRGPHELGICGPRRGRGGARGGCRRGGAGGRAVVGTPP